MQSNRTRAAALVAALAIVVLLFFAFKGGEDGDESTTASVATATTSSEADAKATETPKAPGAPIITIVDGLPEGGVADLTFNKGDQVEFVVDSDTADEVHVHGYDIMEDVEAGGSVRFDFPADIDGIFEVELEGSVTQIAELTVNP